MRAALRCVKPRREAALAKELLGLAAWPCNLNLAMRHDAITQVQVDQALVRNARLISHALEVVHNVFRQAHRDRLLELGRVGIAARLHFGKVVFGFHSSHWL